MLIDQTGIPVISINAIEKEIKLGRMDSLDESNPLSSFRKKADIEDGVPLYILPLMDSKSGKMTSAKCFICTDNDIIETEGIGLIPFDDEDNAVAYMDKLETMIEWQY